MVNRPYNRGLFLLVTSGIDHFGQPDGPTSALACLLVSSSYNFNVTHNLVADVTAHEIGVASAAGPPGAGLGHNYSANNDLGGTFIDGRAFLQQVSSREDDIVNMALMDASDITWTSLNTAEDGAVADSTIYGAVITFLSANAFDDNNELLFFHDLPGAPFTPAGDMTLRWNAASGMAYLASSCG